jgi:hypothetical protein
MAYARVAADAVPAYPKLRSIDQGVNDFLADHIRDLRQLASARRTQPGRFIDSEAQALFHSLCYDPDPGFLAAADTLTKRLIGEMDKRTAAGLLICLRATDASDMVAGVLKLQVVAEHGAVLESLDSGEEVLSAVTKLLDKPGDLQKGALVTSSLPADRAVTGDRLGQDAAYFPAAFSIQIYSRPAESVGELLDAVEEVSPELAGPVASILPSIAPGEPPTVLAALGQKLPQLTSDVQADVAEKLEHRPRPVGFIDTRKRSTETIKIGDITVSGPIPAMRQYARMEELRDQTWQVIVRGKDRPRRSYK